MAESKSQQPFSVGGAFRIIVTDVSIRGKKLTAHPIIGTVVVPLQFLSSVVGRVSANYVNLVNSSDSNYDAFVATPTQDPQVYADISDFMSTSIQYGPWADRGRVIRNSGNRATCIGNLSVALSEMGAAYAAGTQGAVTLLTLLPTANVLIGAPAKELWVLYKLCPLAGMLSILLSLGGNIIPMEVDDYRNIEAFQYDSMVAVADASVNHGGAEDEEEVLAEAKRSRNPGSKVTEAEKFASAVQKRAYDYVGAKPTMKIAMGMMLQVVWIAAIIGACAFLSAGAVVVWLCDFGGWMYMWYGIVALSSILENFAGVPFTTTWTIRVWKCPKVTIDPDSPWVIPPPDPSFTGSETPDSHGALAPGAKRAGVTHANPLSSDGHLYHTMSEHDLRARMSFSKSEDILANLKRGYNTQGKIWMDPSVPWSSANDAFYVLLSVKGVSNGHAILRVFSKLASITTFAVGTALFASATLITIIVAMVTAILILAAAIFGRVTAMYMASEMMQTRPVLHRVVRNPDEAGRFLEQILRKEGIACEVLGHIIIEGRCVKKFGKRLRWSSLLGVLAKPYDLTRMATNGLAFNQAAQQHRAAGLDPYSYQSTAYNGGQYAMAPHAGFYGNNGQEAGSEYLMQSSNPSSQPGVDGSGR